VGNVRNSGEHLLELFIESFDLFFKRCDLFPDGADLLLLFGGIFAEPLPLCDLGAL
jgi:hypothetical protein